MKIILTEKVNKEILQWQKAQTEKIHILSWVSNISYKKQENETNIYEFMRQGPSEYLLQDLGLTTKYILNYRSVPGNHQLEFKDFQQNIVAKVYLRANTQYIERLETIDQFGQTISNTYYSGKQIVQKIFYDDTGHPLENKFFGQKKTYTTYWQLKNEKVENTGLSLLRDGKENFYNNYWDWHFEEFRHIILSLENVTEIISYEAPTLNIHIPNKKVNCGDLLKIKSVNSYKKWIINFPQKNHWKPRNDVAQAAELIGYKQINFDTPYVDSTEWMINQLEKYGSNVNAGDLIVWQYPKYSPNLELVMIEWFHKKRVKIASFIHDVSLLREKVQAREHYLPEIDKKVLASFDANILPTNFVKPLQALMQISLKNVVELSPYDFIVAKKNKVIKYSHKIFYAGSLAKFPELKTINFDLMVYGEKNFSEVNIVNSKIVNGGFLPNKELVNHLNEGFGLIWDEDRQNPYRKRYTQWNWPYKFSLYMAAGLPVIAWSESAIGKVIVDANIGIVVDDLSQIQHKLNQITENQFREMAKNASNIGNKLSKGESTKSALITLENIINNL